MRFFLRFHVYSFLGDIVNLRETVVGLGREGGESKFIHAFNRGASRQ